MQVKNPHRLGMLCSPLEPRSASRLNRVQQKKGFLRLPVLHRPNTSLLGFGDVKNSKCGLYVPALGPTSQLLEAGDEVSIPGYIIVSIRQALSQAGEIQTPKETFGRLCRTGSICPVLSLLLTVSIKCPEHAILGIIPAAQTSAD